MSPRRWLLPLLALLAAGCGEATIETPARLQLVFVSPHHGAAAVSTSTSVEIGFSDPLDRDSVTERSVRLEMDGVALPVRRVISEDQQRVTLVPDSVLAAGTAHDVVVGATIRGLFVGELGTGLRSRFQTRP